MLCNRVPSRDPNRRSVKLALLLHRPAKRYRTHSSAENSRHLISRGSQTHKRTTMLTLRCTSHSVHRNTRNMIRFLHTENRSLQKWHETLLGSANIVKPETVPKFLVFHICSSESSWPNRIVSHTETGDSHIHSITLPSHCGGITGRKTRRRVQHIRLIRRRNSKAEVPARDPSLTYSARH